MLDPDEYAAYEEWKAEKLVGTPDLSVEAFNREQEAVALAWDACARELCGSDTQKLQSTLDRNPYRRSGMRGAPPTKRIITS